MLCLGKKSDNPNDPDYIPSKFSHKRMDERINSQKKTRYDRLKKRREYSASASARGFIVEDMNDGESFEGKFIFLILSCKVDEFLLFFCCAQSQKFSFSDTLT